MPKVVAIRQDGLRAMELEFSEPIKTSQLNRDTKVFGTPEWNAERTKVRVSFDVKKLPELGLPAFYLNSITDDAGNSNYLNLAVPVDNRAPAILAVKRIDSKTWELVLNEDARLSDSTRIRLNEIHELIATSKESTNKTLTLTSAENTALSADSAVITITDISDTYGNTTKKRAGRYFPSDDRTAPVITGIKQLPREIIGKYPYSVFEVQFSEYTVDGRDSDELTGTLGSLSGTLDLLKSFNLNGELAFFFESKWTPSLDHRSAIFKMPTTSFKHMKTNTVELELMDIAGNKAVSKFEFVPDVLPPQVLGSYVKQDQCFMEGARSFRCRVSEPDISNAVLLPEAEWPAASYTHKVTQEIEGENKAYWLQFDFQKDVPEQVLKEMDIVDSYGNRSSDRSSLFLFLPSSRKPELLGVSAFSSSILELRMTGGVESIDAIKVNGKPVAFKLLSEDELRKDYGPKNVLISFQDRLPAGNHRIELEGIHRLRNRGLVTDSIVLETLNNSQPDIVLTTLGLNGDNDQEIRMDLTAPLEGRSLDIFVKSDFDADGAQEVQLKNFTITERPMNSSGVWPVSIRLNSAEGLNANQMFQPMIFRIQGRQPTPLQRILMSTEVPEFTPHYQTPSSRFIGLRSDITLDQASLQLELVDGNGTVTPVPSEWISFEASALVYISVDIPADKEALKPGNYKLRVTAARSKNFGLSIKQPYELDFKIN